MIAVKCSTPNMPRLLMVKDVLTPPFGGLTYGSLFFAFSDIYSKDDKAIYMFRADLKMQLQYDSLFSEYRVELHKAPSGDPLNPRAEAQRSFFTNCVSTNAKESPCFGCHHDVLSKSDDLLTKYIVPYKEKEKVLEMLSSKEISFCAVYGENDENILRDYTLTNSPQA